MNDRFYTNELSEIRSFCNHSDKEDIYMYISSLQQENQRLKEELKYTVPIVEHNKIVSKKLKENQELKKQYCERTDCSGRLGNSKKVDQLEKELEQLKEIEKEHQKINGNLRVEIKELEKENQELKDRIDKAVEYIEKHTENIDRGKYYEDYVETYYLLKILKGDKE